MSHLLVQHYLDHMSAQQPNQVAVTDGARFLGYCELEIHANRIANSLIAQGIKAQDRVAICLNRSIEVLPVILGVLKADAVYVPIDCKAPLERWQSIVSDCTPAAIICDSHNVVQAKQVKHESAPKSRLLQFDLLSSAAEIISEFQVHVGSEVSLDGTRRNYQNDPSDLAYILYTSGSTGKPKGVMISHQNITAYIEWAVKYFQIKPHDKLLGTAPFHFDMSTFDIFSTLKSGCTFCLASDELILFPQKLVNFIEQEQVTIWKGIPSLLMYMSMAKVTEVQRMPSLKTVIFAGEHFPTKYLKNWMETYPEKNFFNAYGPTEATGVSLCHQVEKVPDNVHEKVPIGTPCDETDVFLLTEKYRNCNAGQIGELCIGGTGLSRGYINDQQKTAKSFIHKLVNGKRKRLYKTGDLALLLPCGNYQYIGRKDRQLKFMGYRIEAGDVEHALLSLNGVRDAAVVLHEPQQNQRGMGLVAFVETSDCTTDPTQWLRLKSQLPAYMIPKKIIQVEQIPRCSRGKVDYVNLSNSISLSG